MPYASGRVYHDADAHIMEPADWLIAHADPAFRDRMPRFRIGGIGKDGAQVDWVAHTCPLHLDDVYRAEESQVTLRKNYFAVGAFERDRHPLRRFAESLVGCTEEELERFYAANMADLMGPHIPEPVPSA